MTEALKLVENRVIQGTGDQADAGTSMGVAFLRTDSALYALQRPLKDPNGVLVTRVAPNEVAVRKIGYAQIIAAAKTHTVEKLLEAAF